MAGKTINLLTPLTDPQVDDINRLWAGCDPVSGESGSATGAQLKTVIGTHHLKYVCTGAEGTVLTIGTLAQRDVLLVAREGAIIYEVVSGPDDVEYIWDGVLFTFGQALRAGERLLILWRNN